MKGKVVIKVTFNNKSDLSTSPINMIGQENSVIKYGKRQRERDPLEGILLYFLTEV